MPRIARKPTRATVRVTTLVVALAVLAGLGAWAYGRSSAPSATRLAQVSELPARARRAGKAWVWMSESPTGARKLMRVASGTAAELADSISAFDVEGDTVAWSARQNSGWAIVAAGESGEPKTIWSGAQEPASIKLFGSDVYFLTRIAGLDPASALPPLQDRLEIWQARNGNSRRVAQLMESEPGAILHVKPGALIVSAIRRGIPGSTACYEVSLESGEGRRIHGAEGQTSMRYTPDGSFYWAGPSVESSESLVDTCVRMRSPDGRISTLIDWLPPGGDLALSGAAGGVYFIDGSADPSIWPARPSSALPKPLRLPEGAAAAAVSSGKALLFKREPPGSFTLYEMDLP